MKIKKILNKIIIMFVCFIFVFSSVSCSKPKGNKESENGLLFDEAEFSRIYNYASTVVVEDNVSHIWYCSNRSSSSSGDHVFYRKGVKHKGDWYWGEKQLVLSPGVAGEWDSANVCDPSVIKGDFKYQGETYSWLMAYLGCRTYGNFENSFGFAVANSPEGPWKKVTTKALAPMYDFYSLYPGGGDNMQLWGTGQPSIVSADKSGKVLVFYTKHFDPEWGQMAERWDLSNLDNPVCEFSTRLEATGLVQRNSTQEDYITNADFMYDPYRNVLYTGTDVHPFGPDYPNNIPTVGRVAYADLTNDIGEVIGDSIKDGLYWHEIEQLSEEATNNKRHSNLSFYRDAYGWMVNPNEIEVIYATSQTKDVEDWALIYTWRLYRYSLYLGK